MGLKHWSHEHAQLQLEIITDTDYNPWTAFCNGCRKILGGPSYLCKELGCFFRLCESCFQSSYPHQVPHHPLHPAHPLVLLSGGCYICDGCDCFTIGFVYRCEEEGCDFNLDVHCALLMNNQTIESSKPKAARRRTKQHYIHPDHHLTLFNCKLPHIYCTLCGAPIIGAGYGCCECGENMHESCVELTQEIRHPYHLNHPLRAYIPGLENPPPDGCCAACHASLDDSRTMYQCLFCRGGFRLHSSCAAKSLFTAPMRHERHQHWIHYVQDKHWRAGHDIKYQCDACNTDCEGSYYKCMNCEYHIHLGCLGLPDTVDYPDHLHPLTLEDSYVEDDDSGEYYCHCCGMRRHGDHPVYRCRECPDDAPFAAHIECVTSQEDPWIKWTPGAEAMEQIQLQEYPALVEFDQAKRKPQCRRQIQIQDYSNNHRLTIHRHEEHPFLQRECDACQNQVMLSSYYTCEFCNIHYHKLCAELPPKIRHPLHSQHLLALDASTYIQPNFCDGCLHVSRDGGYRCEECQFELDLKCASSLTAHQLQNSQNNKNTIVRSIHDHRLTPVSCTYSGEFSCNACAFPISDTAYGCFDCRGIFHQRCSEFPKNRQHLYHPQHSLVAKDTVMMPSQCKACNSHIYFGIQYACSECTAFAIHASCAEYMTSTLKSSCHDHILFSFAKEEYPKFQFDEAESSFECKCGKLCCSSFYRCVECDMNFHLDCIPLPIKVIKHEWHSHPLTLVDSMREDDSGEYYCEICCEPRNPNHGAYYCEECKDQHGVLVIAHIGCTLEEVM
ncbi:hypothetical protein Tsubulata_009406 [Turnera subulata]|uniref:Phorbol-ester/DAG-type domain-containing protein n=1 Tax=Turnera subulata TaxID=218843 RepID=A0A9Q0J120_9ROSI|nr:hypothetical protein Tsubulata_009406 [Turnera subulata]